MAPSRDYFIWKAGAQPYELQRPAAALVGHLRAHGLTVYHYPNEEHLRAPTPEDHTPFSHTGWPLKSAWGIGHGVDVMPRGDSAAARKENADIARKLIHDRDARVPGVMWIKYINWTDEQGVCRQERWMPNHETRPSSDEGHIHISGRSDCDNDARADGYDPLSEGDTFMALSDEQQNDLWNWIALLVDPAAVVRQGDRFKFPPLVMQAAKIIPGLQTQVTALTAAVQTLADAVNAAGGNIDTVAIFRKIDEAVAAVNAQVDAATAASVAAGAEARDAVYDLATGGASAVLADE